MFITQFDIIKYYIENIKLSMTKFISKRELWKYFQFV